MAWLKIISTSLFLLQSTFFHSIFNGRSVILVYTRRSIVIPDCILRNVNDVPELAPSLD